MAPYGPMARKNRWGKKHGLNPWKLGIETSMFVSEKVGGNQSCAKNIVVGGNFTFWTMKKTPF
jgi:hypothetical protein